MDTIFPGNPARLRDHRVTLMGLGTFGGGVAAAKYLINNGAALTITDAAAEEQLTKSLDELGDYLDVVQELSLGRHREEDFRDRGTTGRRQEEEHHWDHQPGC